MDWFVFMFPVVGIYILWKLLPHFCYCPPQVRSRSWVYTSIDTESQIEYNSVELDQTPPEIQTLINEHEFVRAISATSVIPPIRLSREL